MICSQSRDRIVYTLYCLMYLNIKVIACLIIFSFQPVLHDWCNKGRGMCYPVCGIMHIK